MTHLAKGNTALSISLTALATLLAIVLTPINLQILGNLYEPTRSILKAVTLSPWQMIKLVSLLLGLPLVLGVTLNHYRKCLALRLGKILKTVSLIIFVALIVVALYNNRVIFQDYIFYVLWLVVLHNLVALITGYSFASLARLSNVDRRTITIETGIQNSGLGLLLIFSFFDGLGGMALLAAFWGIWHLISGLIIAGLWGSKHLTPKK